jgi:hypothetical protein
MRRIIVFLISIVTVAIIASVIVAACISGFLAHIKYNTATAGKKKWSALPGRVSLNLVLITETGAINRTVGGSFDEAGKKLGIEIWE